MSNQFCTQCGASIKSDSKFCTGCGAKAEQPVKSPSPSKDSPISAKTVSTAASLLLGNTSLAAATGGEMTFTQAMPAVGGIIPGVELGPLKYLLGGVGRLFKGITGVFKNKKRFISVLVVSLLWLILLMLPALGINIPALRYLNFLTFAQGGTSGGALGMAGGLVGKGLFAYFIAALFTGSKPFAGLGGGFKSLLGSLAVKEKSALASLLLGAGLALIGYNFLTGNGSLQNSMAGIIAFLISLRAIANKGGFLRGFLRSLFKKLGKGQMPDTSAITRIMAGWATGFAIGVPLSVTGISSIGYLTGSVLAIVAVVLKIVSDSKKEAVAG